MKTKNSSNKMLPLVGIEPLAKVSKSNMCHTNVIITSLIFQYKSNEANYYLNKNFTSSDFNRVCVELFFIVSPARSLRRAAK